MREWKKEITDVNEIPETEAGDLLLMALSIITTECRTDKTPNEVIEEIQKRRFDVIYTDKS